MISPLIERAVAPQLLRALQPGKVVVLLGPRRVGKTVLLRQLAAQLPETPTILNGEDAAARELLARRSIAHYREILGGSRLLFVDEGQKVPEIGSILKLMVDEIPGLRGWRRAHPRSTSRRSPASRSPAVRRPSASSRSRRGSSRRSWRRRLGATLWPAASCSAATPS